MQKYKVLIVDDHRLFCEGLSHLLRFQQHLAVVGVAHDPEGAMLAVERYQPDIVLLDVEMPGGDGIELCSRLKSAWPDLQIIMLTMHTQEEYLIRALESGAFGYVIKDSPSDELISMINSAIKGEVKLEYRIIKKMSQKLAARKKEMEDSSVMHVQMDGRLTAREVEVLKLVSQGYSNKKIAESLMVSEYTVKNHLAKIYEKLKCNNRTEAALAMRKYITSLEN